MLKRATSQAANAPRTRFWKNACAPIGCSHCSSQWTVKNTDKKTTALSRILLVSWLIQSRFSESIPMRNHNHNVTMRFPVAPPGATMAISFQSDEEVLRSLREKLRKMTDQELVRFGKEVRRLAENPFQRQLEEARREWKRSKSPLKPKLD